MLAKRLAEVSGEREQTEFPAAIPTKSDPYLFGFFCFRCFLFFLVHPVISRNRYNTCDSHRSLVNAI